MEIMPAIIIGALAVGALYDLVKALRNPLSRGWLLLLNPVLGVTLLILIAHVGVQKYSLMVVALWWGAGVLGAAAIGVGVARLVQGSRLA